MGEAILGAFKGVVSGGALLEHGDVPGRAAGLLESCSGRWVEWVMGASPAGLSLLGGVILDAQRQGGIVAWVSDGRSLFFPPDLVATGIDVAALPVVLVDSVRQAARAADMLLRSGGFVLVVLDLDVSTDFSLPMQTRLSGLAKANCAALLRLLPVRHGPQRGSLVSLRVKTEKRRIGHDAFLCTAQATKDKRRAPGWTESELYSGTDGLC